MTEEKKTEKKTTQLAVSMVADDPTYKKTKKGFEVFKPKKKQD